MRTPQQRGAAIAPRRPSASARGATHPGQLRQKWRTERDKPGAWELARVWLCLSSACALFWILLIAWIARLLS